ncbi:ABC transporter substrate-binding protein [Motilimonas eburnea]|uniref:ABC transporter substrate-binding protein n=1 Tax=Motilimonas eburnea TaxID=1737488 RepID=UPI001E608720|nr:ABC transporter substrate-binding protein [Motilimonas eburnea]MCE2573037.1 ABC transporter substrate-binding protein [Motilimonas eburnea]
MRLSRPFCHWLIAATLTATSASPSWAAKVEALHWWTSDSESAALNVVKESLAKQGHQWQDFAIVGGGGGSAMTVLRTRAMSGNPPASAQIKGPDIQEWASLGLLQPLTPLALDWERIFPATVTQHLRYQSEHVAIPFNIHRVNALWLNKAIFDELKLTPPQTWDEFISASQTISQAGYIGFAHGLQPWQDALLFESVVIAELGPQVYRQIFVEHHITPSHDQKLVAAFRQFRALRPIVDDQAIDRNWDTNARLLAENKAGMVLMGNWVKGELQLLGLVPEKDYLCLAAPGNGQTFSYNIDTFVFFKHHQGTDAKQAQQALAETIADPEIQIAFNQLKGSIPARQDISPAHFDFCSQQDIKDFKQFERVPSLAQGMANTGLTQNALVDVISHFFNHPRVTPEQAVQQLHVAIKATQ